MTERMIALVRPGMGFACLLMLAAIGAGGCTNVHVRDLQFVGLRKFEGKDHASLPSFVRRQVQDDDVVIEATLSTKRDLVAVAGLDEHWIPRARVWLCDYPGVPEGPRGWIRGAVAFAYRGKQVAGLAIAQLSEAGAATSADVTPESPFRYTIYFAPKDAPTPYQTDVVAYDLAQLPADVCADLGAASFAATFDTNAVRIPASALDELFKDR